MNWDTPGPKTYRFFIPPPFCVYRQRCRSGGLERALIANMHRRMIGERLSYRRDRTGD